MSVGYNVLLNEEIKLLQTEKEVYKLLENQWFHKYIELQKDLKFLINYIDKNISKNIT
jgi:predicted RNA-binding protein with EMAP domain